MTTPDVKEMADPHVEFLREAARYFENRPTGGEDRAHWANVYNAKNCREIADRLSTLAQGEQRRMDQQETPTRKQSENRTSATATESNIE